MFHARHLALVSALALAAPVATLSAREQWGVPRDQYRYNNQYGYSEGYNRGLRAGEEDGRRNQAFNFTDEGDYRNGTAGYNSRYGDRNRYRDDFRRGFEEGYRNGYGRYGNNGRYGDYGRGGNLPPWSNGRGNANGRGGRDDGYYDNSRNNYALQTGFNDGYEAGLSDGRARRRDDPTGESRYRNADRGYNSRYGTREAYKIDYRRAFLEGYNRGYDDGRRNYSGGLGRWWPF